MCAGMCTRWPAPGTSAASLSAYALGARRDSATLRRRGCRGGSRRGDRACAPAPTRATASTSLVNCARAAVLLPVVPRRRVHQRLREERGGVEVVGKARRHAAHRVGVGAIERRALGLRIGGVALGERVDEGALPLVAPAARLRACSMASHASLRRLLGDRRVDVRAERERDRPSSTSRSRDRGRSPAGTRGSLRRD